MTGSFEAQKNIEMSTRLPMQSDAHRLHQSEMDLDFRAIYELEADFVCRNLRRLGVPDADVEDKLQEVFVIAHRRFADYVDRSYGPRAWLFQIALRVAADARRHRRRHPEDADGGAAAALETIAPDQTGALSRRERLARLDRALASIPLEKRAVLILYEIEGQSAADIAHTLGVSVNTVYFRLHSARTELDRALKRI
ncbi:RNA polymerase sigma factor [Pendulispora albinea]|uniref:RNA polymerase sigma factor n=1 Tax=Pendulispora albinea TaxID=2741071 RepID=A0ABZ2LVP9_9BACT